MVAFDGGFMKLSPRPPRTPSRLSDSVHHQLNMYALAATAAGVGVLVLAQPADAKIIYTKAKKFIGRDSTLHLDLNHDGIPDFDFKDTYRIWSYSCAGELAVAADQQKNAIWGHTVRGQGYASALYANVQIGPKGHFVSRGGMAAGSFAGGDRRAFVSGGGPWYDVTNRYLGLKFVIKGQIHFGWARLNVSVTDSCTVTGNLTGYAYESVANRPILTGKEHGTEANDLAPTTNSSGTLGQLAGGSQNRFGK
jgi:hypothetical protein